MGGRQKQLHEAWWFWAILVALIVISFSAGILSTSSEPPIDDEPVPVVRRSRPPLETEIKPVPPPRSASAARSLEKVTKVFQASLIHRLDERRRVMYVNDFNWKNLSYADKEHTTRVVAEYLDSISSSPTGMVDVRSFRRGRLIASINRQGVFSLH